MNKSDNVLGYENISKLIKKFSIPCIISLVVNALYNMVDQFFIGWGVGYLGNGATNVVFPLIITCLSFSLMIGDGTATYFSLKLGENKKEDASIGVANGIMCSIIVSIIFCILTLIFLPQLLTLFGCTSAFRDYALKYGYIIALGIPFAIIGTSMNSIIRADGSPKYSMISMLSGAILNIILDPIFIFVFKMNVSGAAIATIISQFITFILNIFYIRKFKCIKLNKSLFKINFSVIKKILKYGISSFITQISFVIVFSVENNLLAKYGALSKYGSSIPLSVFGIVLKINQILNSIIIGLAVGASPIIGFNYGAGKYDRVVDTIKKIIKISFVTSVIAFCIFQIFPDKLILLFGKGNKLYIEFACRSFRIFLMLCILNSIQIPVSVFFQAIGKSSISAILSLSRQIVLLIPSLIILSNLFGITGFLYAGPVADSIGFIIAFILLYRELKNINKYKIVSDNKIILDNKIFNTHNIVITISREFGSGGRYIGKLIASKLGINFYDKEIIDIVSNNTGLSNKYIEDFEQKRYATETLNNFYYEGLSNNDELFIEESKVIKDIASKGSCVIIGRCSNYILKDNKNVFNIFIYNSLDNKIKRAVKYYGFSKSTAKNKINKINKLRINHYNHYTDNKWGDYSKFDLCINSDYLGVMETANLICSIISNKNNN